jgi:SNF2 family DNA or RNA helicase
LQKEDTQYVEYHGGVSDLKRDRAIDSFLDNPDVLGFVGQPGAGGRGLNLSVAEDVFNYSPTPDMEKRQQADERATQIGGKHIGVVDIASEGTVDEYILDDIQAPKSERSDHLSGHGLKRLLEGRIEYD